MVRRRLHTSQRGAAIAFFAISLPVIILLIGGAFYFSTLGMVREQSDAVLKLILLAAAERYTEYPATTAEEAGSGCTGIINHTTCHNSKYAAAVVKANEIAARHVNTIGDMTFTAGTLSEEDANAGNGILIAGTYEFASQVDGETDAVEACTENCFSERNSTTLANGFRIIAKLPSSTLLEKIVTPFGLDLQTTLDQKTFTAAAIPLRFVGLVDLSSSITWNTHEVGCDYSAYHADADGEVDLLYNSLWSTLPESRDTEKSGLKHFKSDYRLVQTMNDSVEDYLDYNENFQSKGIPARAYHVDPNLEMFADSQQFIVSAPEESDLSLSDGGGNTNDAHHFQLDLYRDNLISPPYRGPEPWQSIYRAVAKTMDIFDSRGVAGDRAGLIFYHSGISWRMGVKLTDQFDYIRDLLGEVDKVEPLVEDLTRDNFLDSSAPNAYAWPTGPYDFSNDMPRWIRLGLFPVPGTQTNTHLAMVAAANLFSQDNEQGIGVPSVDFMAHFGDGLPSCFTDGEGDVQCDASKYFVYRNAMVQIRDFALESLWKKKIVFHKFLFGAHVGPHNLAIDDGSGGCIKEEVARGQLPPIDFVKGSDGVESLKVQDPGEDSFRTGEQAFDDMFTYARNYFPESRCKMIDKDGSVEDGEPSLEEEEDTGNPFYQANTDWYHIVRLTGGRWFPIRDVPDCSKSATTCSPDDPQKRILQDPDCRTVEEQVTSYLSDLISTGGGYVLVDSN